MPSVGEDDLVAGDHGHQQLRDAGLPGDHLAAGGGDEPCRDVLGVPGARTEVPGSGDPVPAVDLFTEPVGKELPAHRHLVVVGGEHLVEPFGGQVGGTGRRRREVGNSDPTQRPVLPGQFDPGVDQLRKGRLASACFRRVAPLHETALPQGVDGTRIEGADSLRIGGLLGHQVPQTSCRLDP